jgi:hypothetical protein
MRSALLVGLVALFICTLSFGYGVANAERTFIKEGNSHGVAYMTGGVGVDERAAMETMAKDFNLKLVFAEPNRPYLANVNVEIKDSRGARLVQAQSTGPWFFASLPDGGYTVTVTHAGKEQMKKVEVGEDLETFTFAWKD